MKSGCRTFSIRKVYAMAIKAGVWIDHKQAVVVLMTDAGHEIKKFKSGVDQPVRPSSSSHPKHKYTPNDFIAEDRRERKLVGDRKKVYDEVLACVRGADSLLILGPGEAKGEFGKHIKAKKVRGVVVELESTDKMTDRQLAAKVKEHYTKAPARKPVARKKTTKPMARKRKKKAGK
jgi:hypothetical protein